MTTPDTLRELAEYLCRQSCPVAHCRECHPGSLYFERAAEVLKIVRQAALSSPAPTEERKCTCILIPTEQPECPVHGEMIRAALSSPAPTDRAQAIEELRVAMTSAAIGAEQVVLLWSKKAIDIDHVVTLLEAIGKALRRALLTTNPATAYRRAGER